eukprot:jgi/Mesvir1/8228/Mv12513-RA.2
MVSRKSEGDKSSFSNPTECVVQHFDLNVDVNFDTKIIEGHIDIVCKVHKEGASLVLDTSELRIDDCHLLPAGETKDGPVKLDFELRPKHPALGSALEIFLHKVHVKAGDVCTVRVQYATSPSSTAVQWLEPEQTLGGKHPYLFTQCQAIHARSLLPCQDCPGVKASYTARVCVPEALTALMSAVPLDKGSDIADASGDEARTKRLKEGNRAFHFHQKVPIPSYLVALAVGQLDSRPIGPRSRVWAEPAQVDAAAHEFSEHTELFLATGEALLGPYEWGVYDLLVLPPSFPYGGMENPCLTFVTPTLLAGDRSLVDVVAHEISHSWTGNLVTNATWEHFWLNEGCTMMAERKILGRIHGEKRFHFSAVGGKQRLHESVYEQFKPDHKFTALVPDLSGGIDPDDAFSSIPYEKGFSFLYYLQVLVGGPDKFDPFFKAYVQHFKYQSIDSEDFKAYFLQYFADQTDKLAAIEWERWFVSPGMPLVENQYDTSLADASQALARRWVEEGAEGASADDVAGWSAQQVIAFLQQLQLLTQEKPLAADTVAAMDATYNVRDMDACF